MMCSRRWYVTNREKIEEDRTARLEKEEADRIAQEEEARLVTSRHGTHVFCFFSNMHKSESMFQESGRGEEVTGRG